MILANELRIGNWIDSGGYDKVTGYNIADAENGHNIGDPIPLSPEILEKAGFVQQIDEAVWFKHPFHLNFDSCFWWCIDGCFEGEEGSQWREIEYLHQLQNIYYALTGHELSINL